MAALFARFKGPSAPPSAPAAAACANCSAPLAVGQTWCLECGTAAPGRLGRGPGLRSSLGVVGVTLLLVTGAVAAAYAALAADSRQATQTAASVPTATSTVPDVAPAAVAPPAAAAVPAAPATAVPAAPKISAATPTPTPAPAPATPAPAATATPKTTTTTPTKTKTTTTTTTPAASPPSAQSATILLDPNAASSYNPSGYASTRFGDPARAIDGDPQTAWTYQIDPSEPNKILVGLAIDLKSPQTVRSITLATPSPGMTVELYGATTTDTLPVSIIDPGWHHLATRSSLSSHATVKLGTGGRGLRFLLAWITHAPPGATKVGISELSVSS